MTEFTFGTWEDTKPKRAKTTSKQPEIVVTEKKLLLSNACMMDRHTLCSGVTYATNRHSYVRCECECGICATFVKEMDLAEIIAKNDAWDEYVNYSNDDQLTDNPEYDAFHAAWTLAKEYYNG